VPPIVPIAAYNPLLTALNPADQDDVTGRTRARAAVGSIDAAVQAPPEDDPAPLRSAAIAAACGALGVNNK